MSDRIGTDSEQSDFHSGVRYAPGLYKWQGALWLDAQEFVAGGTEEYPHDEALGWDVLARMALRLGLPIGSSSLSPSYSDLRDADPVMSAAEQARLLLKGAMKSCREAMKACDHKVVMIELEHAEAAIDLAEGRLGNAQGCQAKRIHEEDPEDW